MGEAHPKTVPLKGEKGEMLFESFEGTNERGDVVKQKTPRVKDIGTRVHPITVRMGFAQSLTRWLCNDCVKDINTEVNALWNKLKSYGK